MFPAAEGLLRVTFPAAVGLPQVRSRVTVADATEEVTAVLIVLGDEPLVVVQRCERIVEVV